MTVRLAPHPTFLELSPLALPQRSGDNFSPPPISMGHVDVPTPSKAVAARPPRNDCCGTTVVEMAFVLPTFLLFVLSLVEFGHALVVKNVLPSACRSGARLGSTDDNPICPCLAWASH